MTAQDVLRLLENAHLAHKAGDFNNACSFYEQFFDQALAVDPIALYGIRLSHCLDGWASLAKEFPGALLRLEQKQASTFADYTKQKEPERFHDYLQISQRLDKTDEAIAAFAQLHASNPRSAAKLSKFVWQPLVTRQRWELCNALLEQPSLKLDELFAVFDEASRMRELDPEFDTLEFETHIANQLLGDLQNLVSVLRHGDRTAEINDLERQFFRGVQSRNQATLNKLINAQGAYLFAAH